MGCCPRDPTNPSAVCLAARLLAPDRRPHHLAHIRAFIHGSHALKIGRHCATCPRHDPSTARLRSHEARIRSRLRSCLEWFRAPLFCWQHEIDVTAVGIERVHRRVSLVRREYWPASGPVRHVVCGVWENVSSCVLDCWKHDSRPRRRKLRHRSTRFAGCAACSCHHARRARSRDWRVFTLRLLAKQLLKRHEPAPTHAPLAGPRRRRLRPWSRIREGGVQRRIELRETDGIVLRISRGILRHTERQAWFGIVCKAADGAMVQVDGKVRPIPARAAGRVLGRSDECSPQSWWRVRVLVVRHVACADATRVSDWARSTLGRKRNGTSTTPTLRTTLHLAILGN